MLNQRQIKDRKQELVRMNKDYLIEELITAEDQLARKDNLIADDTDRLVALRGKIRHDQRIVVSQKKRKGQMDKIAWKRWKEFTKIQIWINILTAIPNIFGAAATGEFTWFMVGQVVMNAIFGPMVFYLQKKAEHYG
jgi:hypothetical protein